MINEFSDTIMKSKVSGHIVGGSTTKSRKVKGLDIWLRGLAREYIEQGHIDRLEAGKLMKPQQIDHNYDFETKKEHILSIQCQNQWSGIITKQRSIVYVQSVYLYFDMLNIYFMTLSGKHTNINILKYMRHGKFETQYIKNM